MSQVRPEYPRRPKPHERRYNYNYDYTNKVWRPQACDEDGKVIAVET